MGNYYKEDAKAGNKYRMEYFDSWFESLSAKIAKEKGLRLSEFLSDITNLTSFKAKLSEVFSADSSLANYVDGMDNEDLRIFYNRPLIQEIVEANKDKESERIDEEIITEPPVDVEQESKEIRKFFKAKYTDKKTGKVKRTVGKTSEFKVKGKTVTRLRDSKGRFVSAS